MAKEAIEIFNSLARKIKFLEKSRERQEGLFREGQIGKRDVEEVYAAIFLNVMASFEGFIEDLFIGLVTGDLNAKRVKVRLVIKDRNLAYEILFKNKQYFSWLPYDNTKNIAKIYFKEGKPFTQIEKDDETHIRKCSQIRNAIAHQSKHAAETFKREVLSGLILAPRDKQPKSFLRSQISLSPPQNKYQQLVNDLQIIARKLC